MNVRELFSRARTAFRIGDTRLAEHLLGQVIEARPRMAQAYNLLGLVHDRAGAYDQAVEQFRRAIALRKNYGEAYNNLGVTLRKLQRYDQSISAFSKALQHSRNRADIHYNLGNVYKALGRHQKAIAELKQAIQSDPGFTPAYNNLGTVYEQLGRLGEAAGTYRRGLEVDSNHPRLHYNLGITLQKTGNHAEAQVEFERALRARPGWVEAMNNLGVVYQLQGKHRQAIQVLQDLLRIDPNNLQARNNLGVVHLETGAADRALSYFRDALKIDPGYAAAAANLGSLIDKGASTSEALAELERLASLSPDNLEARYRLAAAYLELERSEEAAALLTDNLRRNPDHLPSLRALARVHQQAGRSREAQRLYKRLLDLDPGNLDYHLDIARAARRRGELELAEQHLKRYLERAPDDLEVRLRLGEVYLERSNHRQAAALLEEILKVQPENPEAHELLARAYRKMGDPGQALQALERAVTLQGNRDPGQGLSRLREALDAYEETVSEFASPHRERWASNLERLKDLTRKTRVAAAAPPADLPASHRAEEEEEVPIIRIGGREPVLAVSEAEDRIDLDAIEETPTASELAGPAEPEGAGEGGVRPRRWAPPGMVGPGGVSGRFGPSVELRDETPMSLVSLLDGQALYEENPSWRDYQPPPFVPPAEWEPAEAVSQEATPARSGERPPAEEQPLSAGRLVQRVLRPPAWPGAPGDAEPAGYPQGVRRTQVEPPGLPPEPPQYPVPSAGALPETPQYPAPGVGPLPEPPGYPAAPGGEGPNESLRESFQEQAEMIRSLSSELHALRRSLDHPPGPRPGEPPTAPPPSLATQARGPAEPQELSGPSVGERRSPGDVDVREEDELLVVEGPEDLEAPEQERFEPQAPEAPDAQELKWLEPEGVDLQASEEPGASEEAEDREEESAGGLRRRLRDFLRRIRKRLEDRPETGELPEADGEVPGTEAAESREPPAGEPVPPEGPLSELPPGPTSTPESEWSLLRYLEELAEHLPEQDRAAFLHSDARLKIEYIKMKLQGKAGIRRQIEAQFAPPAPGTSSRPEELSLYKIAETFAFIGNLAAYHPDKTVGTMLQSKVKGILQKMKG